MTEQLDTLVRAGLADLHGEAHPVDAADLATGALRRGRRKRIRTTALTAVAAVGAVAGIAAPFVVHGAVGHRAEVIRPAQPKPLHSVDPQPTEQVVVPKKLLTVGTWAISAMASQAGTPVYPSVVYDRARQTYVKVSFSGAVPSPDPASSLVIVNKQQVPYGSGLLDLHTKKVAWLTVPGFATGYYGYTQWSPDGKKALIEFHPKSTDRWAFAIYDVATGARSALRWIDPVKYPQRSAGLHWHPSGQELVLAIRDKRSPSQWVNQRTARLQLFDLDGRPTRTMAVKAEPQQASNWSPDGRYVVATGVGRAHGHEAQAEQIIEVATGKVVTTLPDGWGAGWWLDNGRLVVEHGGYGDATHPDTAPTFDTIDPHGTVLGSQVVKDPAMVSHISIGSALVLYPR